MKLEINIWVLTVVIHFLDIDPSDSNIMIGIEVKW